MKIPAKKGGNYYFAKKRKQVRTKNSRIIDKFFIRR